MSNYKTYNIGSTEEIKLVHMQLAQLSCMAVRYYNIININYIIRQ